MTDPEEQGARYEKVEAVYWFWAAGWSYDKGGSADWGRFARCAIVLDAASKCEHQSWPLTGRDLAFLFPLIR
jgi:hypothetical protein